jgi:hypothetical protein
MMPRATFRIRFSAGSISLRSLHKVDESPLPPKLGRTWADEIRDKILGPSREEETVSLWRWFDSSKGFKGVNVIEHIDDLSLSACGNEG